LAGQPPVTNLRRHEKTYVARTGLNLGRRRPAPRTASVLLTFTFDRAGVEPESLRPASNSAGNPQAGELDPPKGAQSASVAVEPSRGYPPSAVRESPRQSRPRFSPGRAPQRRAESRVRTSWLPRPSATVFFAALPFQHFSSRRRPSWLNDHGRGLCRPRPARSQFTLWPVVAAGHRPGSLGPSSRIGSNGMPALTAWINHERTRSSPRAKGRTWRSTPETREAEEWRRPLPRRRPRRTGRWTLGPWSIKAKPRPGRRGRPSCNGRRHLQLPGPRVPHARVSPSPLGLARVRAVW